MSAAPLNEVSNLPALIDRAAAALSGARTAAEVLEARDMASAVYAVAKHAARLAKAKAAHDELIAAAHRAQADALMIEAQAKLRLADEYDAAQERGEVRGERQRTASSPEAVGVDDLGLSHKDIHEARLLSRAEKAEPGLVKRTLDAALATGEEPTKALVNSAVRQFRDSLPSKSEARRQAAATGGVVLGKDGRFHAGITDADRATTEKYLRLVGALREVRDIGLTPEEAISTVPTQSEALFGPLVASVVEFVSAIQELWEREHEE